jgi:hypothetical protein
MQVLLKLNNGELQLMTEENFETIHELKGIPSYTILGWLHDKKPICNMCNDYLDDDSRPVGAQVINFLGGHQWLRERLGWNNKDTGQFDYLGLGELLDKYSKELLIVESRLWIEKIISQDSDTPIKTITENDFMRRIEELKAQKDL